MTGRGLAICAVAAVALTSLPAAGVAVAQPSPAPCSYTLTPPHVVQVSGTDMVAATVAPGACSSPAQSYVIVACLELQGSGSAGRCAQVEGPGTARVFYSYQPGATYIATGRGCASTGNPPSRACQAVGPVPAAL
jgi:hypothetical protein